MVACQLERSVNSSVLSVLGGLPSRSHFSHKPHKQQRSVYGWMYRTPLILPQLPLPVSTLHGCYGCGVAYRKRVKTPRAAALFCQISALFLFQQRRVCMAEDFEPIHAVRSKGSRMLSAACCDQKQWLHDVRNRSIVSDHCGSHLRRSIRGFLNLHDGVRVLPNHGCASSRRCASRTCCCRVEALVRLCWIWAGSHRSLSHVYLSRPGSVIVQPRKEHGRASCS